jgi:RHS repeat-associated protein
VVFFQSHQLTFEYVNERRSHYYLQARYYDPRPARFISEDTYEGEIENPQSLNMYVYVANNPLEYVDPTGHCIPGSSGCMYQDENPNLLIYQTEIRKNPEDMQYNDKSKEQLKDILGWHWKYFDKHFGEKDLRINVEDLFKTTSIGDWDMQDIALDMFDHFMSGTGTPYRNNTLTNKVRNKGLVKKYVSDIKETVKELLKDYNGDTSKLKYNASDRSNSLMVMQMQKKGINQPSFNGFLDSKVKGYGITIHGFEGNSIELSSVEKNGSKYSGTLHFKLWDNFGLDEEDVTDQRGWAGLRSWYILQHYTKFKGRHKPFLTIIEFDEKL